MKKIFNSFLQSKSFSLKAEGNSMLPILHSGDVVYFRKPPFKKIKVNNLVLIRKDNKLFTHRAIYKNDKKSNFLITKGDNNPESDGKIYPRQIIGKVVKVKREGKEFDPNNIYLLQSSLYLQEIIKIKFLFEKQNTDFVFLKGLPLHLYYEKEHPRRIYADCDVLVNKKDFQRAEKILLEQGYKKQDSSLTNNLKKIKDKESELAYYKIINGFMVTFDLHLEVVFMMTQLGRLEALYPQKPINKLTEECLKTKRQVKINNEFFQILDTKYLILYLALHFFHHNYRGAFRLDFLDKIIRCGHLERSERSSDQRERNTRFAGFLTRKAGFEMTEWEKMSQDIVEFKLQNFVYPAFVLLKKYYQTPIPKSFLKSIKPTNSLTLKLVNSLINTNIFNDEPRVKAGINRFKNLFFLSPEPLWRKIVVFMNIQVIYSVIWIIWNKAKKLLKLKDAYPKHSYH